MKSFLLLIINLATTFSFALPTTQEGWIQEALKTPFSTLTKENKFRCEHRFSSNAYFKADPPVAYGPDHETALKNVFLLCLKKRCSGINQEVSSALNELRNLSDQDFSDYLRSWGKSSEQIDIALKKRHEPLVASLACNEPIQLEAIFGGCYIAHLAVECR